MKTDPLNCSIVASATGCVSFGVVGPATSTMPSPVNDDNGVVSMPGTDATSGTGVVAPQEALLFVFLISSLTATMELQVLLLSLLGASCLLQVLFWQ